MKCLSFYFLFLCIFLSANNLSAKDHNVVIGYYKVSGVCEQCKTRIENAAYIKGVKYAEWNVDTHNLTLKYDSSKTTADMILKSIVKAGHDAENYIAADEDYYKLPSCCHYRTAIKKQKQ